MGEVSVRSAFASSLNSGAASAAYPPGSYAVARSGGWVSVTGTAPYHGAVGWVRGIARCSVTTIDEGDLP